MIVTKIVSRTLVLAFAGITIIMFLCINELFNGTDLTHPVWDRNYNWLILFRDIISISFVGALLGVAATVREAGHDYRRKTVIKRGYQYGHQPNSF